VTNSVYFSYDVSVVKFKFQYVIKCLFLLLWHNEHFVTPKTFPQRSILVASFLVIIEFGVGIESKFQS
jgi:lysophospholipid acyltransferase (LPLAT)-like uncharacterized protein